MRESALESVRIALERSRVRARERAIERMHSTRYASETSG